MRLKRFTYYILSYYNMIKVYKIYHQDDEPLLYTSDDANQYAIPVMMAHNYAIPVMI